MKIFDFDSEIFTEEAMEESQRLINEWEEIGRGASVGDRRQSKIRRESAYNKIQEFNRPILNYLRECVNEGFKRLSGMEVFRHLKTDVRYTDDKPRVLVETNQKVIGEVREALRLFLDKLRGMSQASLKVIQSEAQAMSERVNLINLKESETVTMGQEAFRDRDRALRERGITSSSIPSPPSPPSPASSFARMEIVEKEVKNTIKETYNWMADRFLNATKGLADTMKIEDGKDWLREKKGDKARKDWVDEEMRKKGGE